MALKLFNLGFILLAICLFSGCSATNPAVEKFFNEAVNLHKQRIKLEKKYFITLGHLQKYPNERTLRLQQAELKKQLVELNVKIEENRQQLDLSVKQWEAAVTDKRTEEIFIQNQERKHGEKPSTRRRRRR